MHEPQSLEEWADAAAGKQTCFPGCKETNWQRLERMLEYFLLNNQIAARTAKIADDAAQSPPQCSACPMRWRLRSNRYSFPWELWVARSTERLVTRRSLLTGQPLPKECRRLLTRRQRTEVMWSMSC